MSKIMNTSQKITAKVHVYEAVKECLLLASSGFFCVIAPLRVVEGVILVIFGPKMVKNGSEKHFRDDFSEICRKSARKAKKHERDLS